MYKAFRPWIDGVPGKYSSISRVSPQVIRQAGFNVGIVSQGSHPSGVVASDRCFDTVDEVKAPCASLRRLCPGVDHDPIWLNRRLSPRPALFRRGINIQTDCGIDVRRIYFELDEGAPCGLSVEVPDDMRVFIRALWPLVNGLNALTDDFLWCILNV